MEHLAFALLRCLCLQVQAEVQSGQLGHREPKIAESRTMDSKRYNVRMNFNQVKE